MTDIILSEFQRMLDIDSPTGYCMNIEQFLLGYFKTLKIPASKLTRGGVLADLGGEGEAALLSAHVDTIGLMVRRVKPNGHIAVLPLGGLRSINAVRENARLHTRDRRVYSGTLQFEEPSLHVSTNEYFDKMASFEYEDGGVELVLDEDVHCPEDVFALGVCCGDMISLKPRYEEAGGFIKSQYIDDKICAAMMLALAKELKEEGVVPQRRTYLHFSVTEEVVGGAAHGLPQDVTEMLALDIGCVGPRQYSTEHKVSICARDGKWPYDYGMITKLKGLCEREQIDYAIDIFHPRYGSDAQGAMTAGCNFRAALIGPGVYGTHGYERTHKDAVENTYALMRAYVLG